MPEGRDPSHCEAPCRPGPGPGALHGEGAHHLGPGGDGLAIELRGTGDFGEIVFSLIDAGLLSRRAEDSRLDFVDAFDFDHAFAESFRDRLEAISETE